MSPLKGKLCCIFKKKWCFGTTEFSLVFIYMYVFINNSVAGPKNVFFYLS